MRLHVAHKMLRERKPTGASRQLRGLPHNAKLASPEQSLQQTDYRCVVATCRGIRPGCGQIEPAPLQRTNALSVAMGPSEQSTRRTGGIPSSAQTGITYTFGSGHAPDLALPTITVRSGA